MTMSPPELATHLFGNGLEALRIEGTRALHSTPFTVLDDDARRALEQAEVLIAAWGAPALSDTDLDRAPRLRYLLYAGGQGSALLPDSAGDRGLQVSNAGWLNAIPVAEFTVAMIVLANKKAFEAHHLYRTTRSRIDRELEFPRAGNREKTIGVVAASRIGRMVIERLRDHDLRVQVYDPYLSSAEAQRLDVRRVELDELMRTSDVVTLHPPLNASTKRMINAGLLAQLRDGSTLINTSRGDVVDQAALLTQLRTGRISAILDVTSPEVLPRDHELYTLPNVFLTPHISGSMGTEIRRLGDHVATELERIALGRPLAFPEVLQ
ncbi:hydroxyacid dehydrogenase [Humibacter sp.]|uniref:hydroxyacid dehydrogenase n=1 Tax=Humibacter sp. TaxID=1940291 RepID=UPI002C5BB66D|nr:hydroxyacid dehydrogenase [Humibacter sp.]HVX09124.1 hydroxyacid dehydrogenase [Humibacter sp.]